MNVPESRYIVREMTQGDKTSHLPQSLSDPGMKKVKLLCQWKWSTFLSWKDSSAIALCSTRAAPWQKGCITCGALCLRTSWSFPK